MSECLRGHATAEGTRRGAESFGSGARSLGRTGLSVSPVGFGGYRVHVDSPLHRRALADALRGGANLVDTATNYGDGASEQLVGAMLANLVQQGELRRDQVVLVSKVGYAQGTNLERINARAQAYPDMLRLDESNCHCLHPTFIADQVEESLARLGVATIDVVLLHNPEVVLEHGKVDAEGFHERLKLAFAELERLVEAGKICWYGVSSNAFARAPCGHVESGHVDLRDVVAAAQAVAGDEHHFAVVQLPMNLFELGAAVGGDVPSPLDVAATHDLGVLLNRPLNAFVRRGDRAQPVRIADPDPTGSAASRAQGPQAALARVRKLEAAWATGLGKQLVTEEGDNAVDLFRWGQEISAGLAEMHDLATWMRLRHDVIAVHLGRTSAALLSTLEGEVKTAFASWWSDYGTALHAAFEQIEASLRVRGRDLAAAITQATDPHLPSPWRDLPLARKAVLCLLSAPVSCVLVGMRQPGYVHDMLALREHPIRLLSAGTGPVDFSALAADIAQIQLEPG